MSERHNWEEKLDGVIRKKGLPKHERKPLTKAMNRKIKFAHPKADSHMFVQVRNIRNTRIKENQSILQANVSLIEGSSFTSNKQDHSMDSMDKMIIGVTGTDERDSEDDSKFSGGQEVDFTAIHKEYEELIGRDRLLDEEQDLQDQVEQEGSRVLPEEQEDWQQKQEEKAPEKLNFSSSPTRRNELKRKLARIESGIQEIRAAGARRHQDISTSSIKNLNMGNLSAIHEERETRNLQNGEQQNKVGHEEDEEDLIDFVSHPDPDQTKKNKEIRPNSFVAENTEWDDESPMLATLQLQLEKDNKKGRSQKNRNYQHLLQELDSKEESDFREELPEKEEIVKSSEEPKEEQNSKLQEKGHKFTLLEAEQILKERERWIKSVRGKSAIWRKRELSMLQKFGQILKNPYYDLESSQESAGGG